MLDGSDHLVAPCRATPLGLPGQQGPDSQGILMITQTAWQMLQTSRRQPNLAQATFQATDAKLMRPHCAEDHTFTTAAAPSY